MKISDDGFRDRLKGVIARLGGLKSAASLLSYSPDQVAKWRDGVSKAPFQPMAILADATGVTLDWLAYGREQMSSSLRQANASDPETATIPLLSIEGSAGHGIQNHGIEVRWTLPFPLSVLRNHGVHAEHAHFITARGDSMVPTIRDGAIVLVDTARRKSREDGIYALVVGDDVKIKRVLFGVSNLTLISDNADKYPREVLGAADIEQVQIVGKAFWAGGGI